MKSFAFTWRTSLVAAAAVQLITAAMALATDVTVWCWDNNFNGASIAEASGLHLVISVLLDDHRLDQHFDRDHQWQTQLGHGTSGQYRQVSGAHPISARS